MDVPFLVKFFLIGLAPTRLIKGLVLNIIRATLVGGVANGEDTLLFGSFRLILGISKKVKIRGLDV
jgi:hypothetical protein